MSFDFAAMMEKFSHKTAEDPGHLPLPEFPEFTELEKSPHYTGRASGILTMPLKEDAITQEEALERYSFIGTILRKYLPHLDEAFINDVTLKYHDEVTERRQFLDGIGAIEGWKSFATRGSFRSDGATLRVTGIRDDGALIDKKLKPRNKESFAEIFKTSGLIETVQAVADTLQHPDHSRARLHHHDSIRIENASSNFNHFSIQHRQRVEDEVASKANKVMLPLARHLTRNAQKGIAPKDQDKLFKRIEGELKGVMRNYEADRLGKLRKYTANRMAPEVMKLMRSLLMSSTKDVHFLTGHSGDLDDHPDPTIARNRQQAIAAFPVFAMEFREKNLLLKPIDKGDSVKGALSDFYRVPAAIIGKLQGATWQKLSREFFNRPHKQLSLVSKIQVDHFPKTRQGWSDLTVAGDLALEFSRVYGGSSEDTLKSLNGRFDMIARMAGDHVSGGIGDTSSYIEKKLVMPIAYAALSEAGMPDYMRDMLFENPEFLRTVGRVGDEMTQPKSLRDALANSARFHRNLRLYDSKIITKISGDTWEPMVGKVDLPNGWTATELCSEEELREEGVEMDHCVGGYIDDVLAGKCLIFSIRNEKGDRMSTLEVTPDLAERYPAPFHTPTREEMAQLEDNRIRGDEMLQTNAGRYVEPGEHSYVLPDQIRKAPDDLWGDIAVQNMAYDDEEPCQQAKTAASDLLKVIRQVPQEKRQTYANALSGCEEAYLRNRRSRTVADQAGYEPTDPEQLATAFDTLKDLLPKKARKLGLEGLKAKFTEVLMQDQQKGEQVQARADRPQAR